MTPIEFLNIYDASKKQDISSVRLFYDVMTASVKNENGVWFKPNFHKVSINGNIPLNREDFTVWTEEYYQHMLNYVGMTHAEIYLHSAPKSSFETLDEFMWYIGKIENPHLTNEHLMKYPHQKGILLSEADFRKQLYFYIDEMFMNKKEEVLLGIPITNYKEGYCFFEGPYDYILGCDLSDKYLAMSYYPYT